MKRTLTKDQEFEIMRLVLDKFLWIGFFALAFGLYKIFQGLDTVKAIMIMATGAVILIIFMALMIREFEISR